MSATGDPLSRDSTVLVSACLLGEPCRYDGRDARSLAVCRAVAEKQVVPICPEAGAGLGIPRPAVELTREGRALVKESGADVTSAFLRGACLAVEAARRHGARVAILAERSPSCGTRKVWVEGKLVPGQGMAAAALAGEGVTLISDEECS